MAPQALSSSSKKQRLLKSRAQEGGPRGPQRCWMRLQAAQAAGTDISVPFGPLHSLPEPMLPRIRAQAFLFQEVLQEL